MFNESCCNKKKEGIETQEPIPIKIWLCCGKNTTPPFLTCSTQIMETLPIKILPKHFLGFLFLF